MHRSLKLLEKISKIATYSLARKRIATVGETFYVHGPDLLHFKMDPVKSPTPKQQFYRRKLPDACISFSSPEGVKLFTEALATGHMRCYFKLASQFSTQAEPAFCGLTTLVMILNSLEVDPGRVWKGPWRWYHEDMLDCCVPLQLIQQDGITFDQFLCLANCNGLDTNAVRPDSGITEDDFRKKVVEYTTKDDSFLVLSYSRKVLGQTGDGHFSPIGGYHPEQDMVLVLDTARFKYPPHWIPVSLLWESMKALDKTTGEPRGYVTMARLDQNPLLLLFRISPVISISLPCGCTKEMSCFVNFWQTWLSEVQDNIESKSVKENLEPLVRSTILALQKSFNYLKSDQSVLTTQLDMQCLQDVSQQHKCAVHQMLKELEELVLFQTVDKVLSEVMSSSVTDFDKAGRLASEMQDIVVLEKIKCDIFSKIRHSHFVTVFLLCWPYDLSPLYKEQTNGFLLNTFLADVASSGQSKRILDEIMLLRKQLHVMLSYFNESKEKTCCCKS